MVDLQQKTGIVTIGGTLRKLSAEPWKQKLDDKTIRTKLNSIWVSNIIDGVEACAVKSILGRDHPPLLHKLEPYEFAEIQAQIAYKLMQQSLHKAHKADKKQHRYSNKLINAKIKALKTNYKESIDHIMTLLANNHNKEDIDNNTRALLENFRNSLNHFDEKEILNDYSDFMRAAEKNKFIKTHCKNQLDHLESFKDDCKGIKEQIMQYDQPKPKEKQPNIKIDALRTYYKAQEVENKAIQKQEILKTHFDKMDRLINELEPEKKIKDQLKDLKGYLEKLNSAKSGKEFLEEAKKFRIAMNKNDSPLHALYKLFGRNTPNFSKQTKEMKKIAKAVEDLTDILEYSTLDLYTNLSNDIKILEKAEVEKDDVKKALKEAREAFLTEQEPNRIQAQSNRPPQSASNGGDTFLPGRAAHSQQQASQAIMSKFKESLTSQEWRVKGDGNTFIAKMTKGSVTREAQVSQSANNFSFSGDAAGSAFQQFIESGDNHKNFNITITGNDKVELEKFVEQLIKDGIEINDTTKVKIGSEEPISLNKFVESSDKLKSAREQKHESSAPRRANVSGT